ncbi:MAG: hypothetical protein GY788_26345, partial [bacterium]|nr:hypothetical protein [bacterium]
MMRRLSLRLLLSLALAATVLVAASVPSSAAAAPGQLSATASYSYDAHISGHSPTTVSAADQSLRRVPVSTGDLGHVYDHLKNFYATNTPGRLPTAETWGRLDTLDDHFLRHGADFGASTADEYA